MYFFGFQSGVVDKPGNGWPATGGALVLVGGPEQGGVSGWFRSMQSPRRWYGGDLKAGPRGDCVALMSVDIGLAKNKRGGVVSRYVFKYRKGRPPIC